MAAEFGLTCISAHRMDATKALLKPATAYPEEEPGDALRGPGQMLPAAQIHRTF